MGKVVKFRMRRRSRLPPDWQALTKRRKASSGMRYAIAGLVLGGIIGVGIITVPTVSIRPATQVLSPIGTAGAAKDRTFTLCHTGGGTNCVVDGDTVWIDGVKIRVADIDAPETHPPRCAHEAELGNRATQRLFELINQGPVIAEPTGTQDEDRYGRKLRILMRDGQSLGGVLVQEGLARSWQGSRQPWC
jgi:micrococcal nuclease